MAEVAAGVCGSAHQDEAKSVCVIGAGVLGLTTAWELSNRGYRVTLLDSAGPDEVLAGASHRSFAWINANNKPPSEYHQLNVLGMAEHDRLQQDLGGHWFHQSGSIVTSVGSSPEHQAEFLDQRLTRLREMSYPAELVVGEDLTRLEPVVNWARLFTGVPRRALYFPTEGWLDQDLLASGLLTALATFGVAVQQATVTHVDSSDLSARVFLDDGAVLTPDAVVIAAGAGSRRFGLPVADLDHPDERTHSFLGLTDPTDVPLGRVLISDVVNVRPRHDGRLWVQLPGLEHRVGEVGEVDEFGEVGSAGVAVLDEVRHQMEAVLGRLFSQPVPVSRVYLSGRSLPEDGFPLVGFSDPQRRIYALVAHSGMTLCALLGSLTAAELSARLGDVCPEGKTSSADGAAAELLRAFRPGRPAGAQHAASSPFIGRQ